MLNLTVSAAKKSFFDRARVKDAMDKATHKALSRFGAYVRQRARTSIRYREKPSVPGAPPSGHRTGLKVKVNKRTGSRKVQTVSPLREWILFAYDAARRSVVIGPALLNAAGGARALAALEYGGVSVVADPNGRRRPIRVRARPFMRPAFQAELRELPARYRGTFGVRG